LEHHINYFNKLHAIAYSDKVTVYFDGSTVASHNTTQSVL